MNDPKRIVAAGYDEIAERFAEWQRGIRGSTRLERLDDLLARLPPSPDVLELGSGAGVRSTRILAERGSLIGVDISAEQIRRARERIPEARFVHGDLAEVEFADAAFDAVVSFYVLNNLPREELGPLFGRIVGWLRPGGYFLGSLPASDNPAWRGEWLGVEMFFSGYEPDVTLRLLAESGLELVDQDLETMVEPYFRDGAVTEESSEGQWLWVLARRPEP